MMAFTRSRRHALVLAGMAVALMVRPAAAASCCGGGSSCGTASEMGALGGAASMYALGHRFLLQESISLRGITGSFTETGAWSPPPVDGALGTLQGTMGLVYFPVRGASIGITLPAAANALSRASWGPFGSINATETPAAFGGALGDISLQGSYQLWNNDELMVSAWGGLQLPTGQAFGDPAGLTGAGLLAGQLGMTSVAQWDDWEALVNVGTQLPIVATAARTGIFALGPTLLYQLQVQRLLGTDWRLGIGCSGYLGQMASGATAMPAAKLKLTPSVTYQWDRARGVRLGLGIDPMLLGRNAMTDATLSAVFFQFLN
jgi:hypothetical protein